MQKLLIISLLLILSNCGSSEKKVEQVFETSKDQAILIYEDGLAAIERQEYFYAASRFSEAEILLPQSKWAAKSALMSGYCYYAISFYSQSISNLERFTKTYPASKNLDYAHYLIALSYYEQILDEEKDIEPLIQSKKKIEFFLKEFPNTDYAIDLKFKLELVINQLAAKEMSIARYYIKNEKWIAAINRLKNVVDNYDETIFIEEALFRLVEIYYKIGLENESTAAAALLGYNYGSSEWYKKSYKILNKDYKIPVKKVNKKDNLVKRTIKKILSIDEK